MPVEPTFAQLARRLISPDVRTPSAKTVEAYGWLIFLEGGVFILAPHWLAALLGLPDFSAMAAIYFRLAGMVVSGIGMLYIVSGRLDARGFVFASLLDRPLVPLAMFGLWYWADMPAVLAIAFSIEDFGSFLWTAWAWRNLDARA